MLRIASRIQHTSYANIEGIRENGYEKMPPVKEKLPCYLSMGEASSLKILELYPGPKSLALTEEESQEKKTELMKTQKDVQLMIQNRIKKIQDIKHSAEVRKGFYTELLEMMEEQQKAAEKQEQELIEELEQEITELKMRNTEL
ncbi:hypothetical protein cypCar_00045910, partial [Cyprinus carpio]